MASTKRTPPCNNPFFRTLQAPFNFLDWKMADQVFPLARSAGVGILTRSAFLRGVLTDDPTDIPAPLQPLRDAATVALAAAGDSVHGCAELALRFCLSLSDISSVLIGVRSQAELEANVAAASHGPLDGETRRRLGESALADEYLLSPVHWTGWI
jgi:aryl-alcohol dehydrogenase-like predicted oxidoreductase